MDLTKRGFLKVAGGVAGALGLQLYAEPLIAIPKRHEWIEDCGDFYIVRVPSGKTFSNEKLDKPTVFQGGVGSTIHDVAVVGFANIYAGRGLSVSRCSFDASRMDSKQRDCCVMAINLTDAVLNDLIVIGPMRTGIDRAHARSLLITGPDTWSRPTIQLLM